MADTNAAWLDVLDQIEASLQQSLERIAAPAPPPPMPTGPTCLGKLDERLSHWQACLDRAEASAASAEALLDAELAAVSECREGLTRVRELWEKHLRVGGPT